jgi:broad specificity phosphatase PhoE
MHVYLVRHGETFLAHQGIHQSPNTPLSPKGKEQAESVAEYLRPMNPSLILTSPYTRAAETARVIALHTGKKTTQAQLFTELIRPSSLYHTRLLSLATFRYVLSVFFKRYDASWHYEDGENYADLSARARNARIYLESYAAKKREVIVIVSHMVFIHVLVALLCQDRMPSTWEFVKLAFGSVRMPHTGIIHLAYEKTAPRSKTCAWRIIND